MRNEYANEFDTKYANEAINWRMLYLMRQYQKSLQEEEQER